MTGIRRRPATMFGVLATGVAVMVLLAVWHGIGIMRADDRHASAIAKTTAVLEGQIARGRYVATHLQAQIAEARRLSVAVPATVDDQSILAGVVAATAASGTNLTNEQRSEPGSAAASTGAGAVAPSETGLSTPTGAVRLPLTIAVNGPDESSLVAIAAALQHQRRLLSMSSLSFTFSNGATLQLTGSAFERSSPLQPWVPLLDRRR